MSNPVLSVDDLKAHLNVTSDADDDLLSGKINAATEWVGLFVGTDLTESTTVAAPIVEAIRQLAGHLYENREASLVGVTAQELPFGLLDLLTPYRAWAF